MTKNVVFTRIIVATQQRENIIFLCIRYSKIWKFQKKFVLLHVERQKTNNYAATIYTFRAPIHVLL